MAASSHQNLRYSSLKQTDSESEEDWQHNYRSAFTYAAPNDLDHMGYVAPKRFAAKAGPRYHGFSYNFENDEQTEETPASIQISALETVIVGFSYLLVFLTLPVSLLFTIKFVGSFERLVVLRLGRAQKLRGPGTTIVLPCIDSCTRVDLRINAFNVPPMQIITIDRGLVELGATIFLQIKDAKAAVLAIQERNQSTRTLAITTLTRLVCKKQVSDIIGGYGKTELAESLKGELCEMTVAWGIEVTKVELSDVKVIKDPENTALSTFSKVLKSDFGNEVLKTIGNTVQEFIAEKQETKRDLIDFSETNATQTPDFRPEDRCESSAQAKSKEEHLELDQFLGLISMVIDDSLVALVGHVFQIECPELGDFYIDLKNAQGSCSRGRKPAADVTFRLSETALRNFITKKLSPIQAYLDGSVQIVGSKKAAMKLSLLSDRLRHLI